MNLHMLTEVFDMNKYFILSIMSIVLGIILMGLGISQGQGKVYWIVIFPVFEGTGALALVGILLIIIGIFLLMISFATGSMEWMDFDDLEFDRSRPKPIPIAEPRTDRSARYRRPREGRERRPAKESTKDTKDTIDYDRPKNRKTSIKTGGVVFIGPIPIIWGSDRKIAYIMALVSVVLVVIFLIFALALFM